MKPVKSGTVKTNFDIGHDMESVIAKNFFQDCSSGLQHTYNVVSLNHVGLFRHGSKDYITATPDYLALIKGEDESYHPTNVEIKMRTTLSSKYQEIQNYIGIRHTVLQADSVAFKNTVTRKAERAQLMHQAVTIGIKLSILVVRDRKGRILKGIWVDFSETILMDYDSCLDDIFENSNFATLS